MGAKQANTANGDEGDDNDCCCSQYLVAKYNDMPIAATATTMEIIPIHKVAMLDFLAYMAAFLDTSSDCSLIFRL